MCAGAKHQRACHVTVKGTPSAPSADNVNGAASAALAAPSAHRQGPRRGIRCASSAPLAASAARSASPSATLRICGCRESRQAARDRLGRPAAAILPAARSARRAMPPRSPPPCPPGRRPAPRHRTSCRHVTTWPGADRRQAGLHQATVHAQQALLAYAHHADGAAWAGRVLALAEAPQPGGDQRHGQAFPRMCHDRDGRAP